MNKKILFLLFLQLAVFIGSIAFYTPSYACDPDKEKCGTLQPEAWPEINCSSDLKALEGTPNPDEKGILTIIVEEIQDTLKDAYESLYEGILASQFPSIASALMVLSVIIFGIMFALGMVQMPLNDALKRIIRMLVVASIVGPGGLAFFNEYVYSAFREGTDELLYEITSVIAAQVTGGGVGSTTSEAAGPFKPMDDLIKSLINPSMSMNVEAAAKLPPYGLFYVAVMFFGGLFLLGAIARAVWVYLVSLVAMAFLFGIAPIFITFILFQQTRNMFDAWLKQLVNFSLQPIFMFTFIGFFIVMMQESLKSIVEADVCYVQGQGNSKGTAWEPSVLRFKDENGKVLDVLFESDGPKCMKGGNKGTCDGVKFPLDFIDILTFALLGYVAQQFYNYVVEMSQDISGAYINLETASPVNNFIKSASGLADKAVSNVVRGKPAGDGIIPGG